MSLELDKRMFYKTIINLCEYYEYKMPDNKYKIYWETFGSLDNKKFISVCEHLKKSWATIGRPFPLVPDFKNSLRAINSSINFKELDFSDEEKPTDEDWDKFKNTVKKLGKIYD